MLDLIRGILTIFVLYLIIAWIWQLAEKRIYGVVTPRVIDDIVAIILAISLYLNLK